MVFPMLMNVPLLKKGERDRKKDGGREKESEKETDL